MASVILPGGGARVKSIILLGQSKLRIYTLPAGGGPDASSFDVASLGKATLSLTVDKCLCRKSTNRVKRDCIDIVILK